MKADDLYAKALAAPCPRCEAPVDTPCTAPELLWAPTPLNRQHGVRIRTALNPVAAPVIESAPPAPVDTVAKYVPPVQVDPEWFDEDGLLRFENPLKPGAKVVIFDIETASAAQLHLGGHEGPFVRLCGWMGDDGVPHTSPNPQDLIDALNAADVIVGHYIFFFDLIALAVHCGADYDALARKAVCTLSLEMLIDPPLSKGMPAGYYSLDATAKRVGHEGKTDNIQALAKKHNGFDRIPFDDPDYILYLHGDLKASWAVWEARRDYFTSTPYAWREMAVEALKGRMSLNGWRVDRTLLEQRVREEDAKRVAAVAALHERYGMPTHRPDIFKVRKLADWGEPRKGKYPTLKAVRRYTAVFPDAAVERGYADRVPGAEMKSPWATRAGKDALIAAFAAAGAVSPKGNPAYPKTKTGDIALGKNELGEGTWYCPTRKKSFPGMLQHFGHIAEVRELVELILTASGARVKYAEVRKFMTPAGRVHSQIGASQGSGRWAHTAPSTTNMGARGESVEERAVLISDDGCIHITGDLATADVRGLAILSQDPKLIAMLQPGEDYHTGNAVIFFGDPGKRKPAKAIGLGAGYGQGAFAIAERNGLEQKLVQDALDERDRQMPKLAQWTADTRALGASGALLDNGFGRKLRPDPERAHTQSLALPGQSASRDIMTESMLRLVAFADEAGIDVRPMLRVVVHDELVLDVPEGLADTVSALLERAMTWEYQGVPILCDLGIPAKRWRDCVND